MNRNLSKRVIILFIALFLLAIGFYGAIGCSGGSSTGAGDPPNSDIVCGDGLCSDGEDCPGDCGVGDGDGDSDGDADPDLLSPEIVRTVPLDNAIDVALDSNILIEYEQPVNCDSVSNDNFTLTADGISISGSLNCHGSTLTFDPDDYLVRIVNYVVTVSGIVSATGESFPDYTWDFNPSVIFVNLRASGSNNGISWNNAYRQLQPAIDSALPGSKIWVSKGVYYPTVPSDADDDRTKSFNLKNNVEIYGGFPSVGGTWDQRKFDENITVLSGDLDENDEKDANGITLFTYDDSRLTINSRGNNSYQVVRAVDIDSSSVLDGFVITGGLSFDGLGPMSRIPDEYEIGAGLFSIRNSSLIRNIRFIGNRAGIKGGGVYEASGNIKLENIEFLGNESHTGAGLSNNSSNAVLNNVTFSRNHALLGGGMYNLNTEASELNNVRFLENHAPLGSAISNSNSIITLTNATFTENHSSAGAVDNRDSDIIINDSTFSSNIADSFGGAIYNREGSRPVLKNVNFIGNSADDGGAIYNDTSVPKLTNVNFSENSATNGGAIYNNSSNIKLAEATFSSNIATAAAGAIYNNTSNPLLLETSFTGNSAETGGALYNAESNPVIRYSTFSNNRALSSGGAIYNYESAPDIINTTFTENSAVNGGAIVNNRSIPSSLVNITFYNNSAASIGGAIYNYLIGGVVHLINNTFTGNSSDRGEGGAIYNDGIAGDLVEITQAFARNSIFYNNGGVSTFVTDTEGVSIQLDHSFLDLLECPEHCECTDTILSADYNPFLEDNIHLNPEIIGIIDGGRNLFIEDALPAGITTDQDGTERIIDGDGDGTATVDMGAFEYNPES